MDEQQLQQQIIQLVQAAMQGDQLATQQIQQIMQAAQQGNQQAAQIAQMIQQVALQMQQQQVQAARFGAKLNYIKQLKGQCPEGYKMEYYKEGGLLCKKCMKVHQDGGEVEQTPNTVAGQFKMEAAKCGKKMKKKEEGGTIESEKCGGKPKLRKRQNGGPVLTDVMAVGINGNNYISNPGSKLHARNALAAANGQKTTSTTVNWSDGTSTLVNGQNRTVTGRDGATYLMGTAPADSVMRNDIAGPYLATHRSGQPFLINDRSRRMGVNTFRR